MDSASTIDVDGFCKHGWSVVGIPPCEACQREKKLHARLEILFDDITDERERQDEKWGEQNHAATVWLTVLGEEVGELAEAILEHRAAGKIRSDARTDEGIHPQEAWRDHMRKEAIQTAAVAVAIVEWIDRGMPVKRGMGE